MRLFYREIGEGDRCLIVLHGLLGMSDNWLSIAKIISESLALKIIIPDQRNHGLSKHHHVFNYDALVDDLDELYDYLNIEHAILLGHSMGGKVAMQFALSHPEKVSSLIVADISPISYKSYRHVELIELMYNTDFAQFVNRKQIETYFEEKVNDKRLIWFLLKNIYEISKNTYAWKLNIESLRLNLEEVFKFDIGNNVFEKETLFLKGELSDFIQTEHLQVIKSMFPNYKMQTISNAGHWLHADNQKDFIDAVVDFIG